MHFEYLSPEEKFFVSSAMLLGILATFAVVGAVLTKYRVKRPERAKMVYEAYVKTLDNTARHEADVFDLTGMVGNSTYVAAKDSAKYANELYEFFTKNVDKLFTRDDFYYHPSKVIDQNWIEWSVNHKNVNNKRFAKRREQFRYASRQYSNAVKTLNVQRRYKYEQGR